jgi:hypothetical protein
MVIGEWKIVTGNEKIEDSIKIVISTFPCFLCLTKALSLRKQGTIFYFLFSIYK